LWRQRNVAKEVGSGKCFTENKSMEGRKMDETELDEYADYEGISKSDIFLKDHYEELFYMTPKELAIAINAMNEDELIQFNQTIHKGNGMNVCLMRDKLDVLGEYLNLNSIFEEAHWRTSIIDGICSLPDYSDFSYKETFHKMLTSFKCFFEDDNESPNTNANSYEILYYIYPAFREHFSKLKTTGIIEETENGLKWNRSKTAAAEYFDNLECRERNRRWVVVEKVFRFKDLYGVLKLHKERQNGKPTRGFEEIKLLLELD
jgi:hypothetical protein